MKTEDDEQKKNKIIIKKNLREREIYGSVRPLIV